MTYLYHPIHGTTDIKIDHFTITNPYTIFGADQYNAGYESINWAETYKYYPPNGIQYINPYQRRFPCTDTRQLCVPAVPRKAATPVTAFSQWNRNPVIYLGSGY